MLAASLKPTKTKGTSSGPTDAMPGICGSVSYEGGVFGAKATYLEGRQGDCWQWRRVVVESVGGSNGAFELNVRSEVVRCELYIAVLDVVNDTFGKIYNALGCVRARMINSSHGQ